MECMKGLLLFGLEILVGPSIALWKVFKEALKASIGTGINTLYVAETT